jgi:hypothetical protein
MDSQPTNVRNFMYFNYNGSGKVCRIIDVVKLKIYRGGHENKFMRQ